MTPRYALNLLGALTAFGVVLIGAAFVAGGLAGTLLFIPGFTFTATFGLLWIIAWVFDLGA